MEEGRKTRTYILDWRNRETTRKGDFEVWIFQVSLNITSIKRSHKVSVSQSLSKSQVSWDFPFHVCPPNSNLKLLGNPLTTNNHCNSQHQSGVIHWQNKVDLGIPQACAKESAESTVTPIAEQHSVIVAFVRPSFHALVLPRGCCYTTSCTPRLLFRWENVEQVWTLIEGSVVGEEPA